MQAPRSGCMKRLGLLVCAALALPTSAQAATVHVGDSRASSDGVHYQAVKYDAADGEANHVHVDYTRLESDLNHVTATVSDSGAVIDAGTGCHSLGDHEAACKLQTNHMSDTELNLGDRDNTLDVTRNTPYPIAGVYARAGLGDDRLDGGDGPADFDGGGGRDHLIALGGGNLTDGDRSGAHGAAGPGPDVLEGGRVSYAQRTRGVKANLSSNEPAGEPGEGDVLRNVHALVGGRGPDRLTGDSGFNEIAGGPGADRLDGRGGHDFVEGGRGRDRVIGGSGSDELFPGPGRDSLSCGAGKDVVSGPAGGELMSRRCETIYAALPASSESYLQFAPYPVSVSKARARFVIPCPEHGDLEVGPCAGTLKLRDGSGRLLARGEVDRSGASENFDVHLTRRGRRLTRRPRGVVATATLGDGFAPAPVSWTIRLKRG